MQKLTPAEQAVVDFYKGEWKKHYPVNKPFKLSRFTQYFNAYNTIGFYEIQPSCMRTYLRKCKILGLVKCLQDDYTSRKKGAGCKFWIDAKVDYWTTPTGRKLFPEIDGDSILMNLNRKIEGILVRDGVKYKSDLVSGYFGKILKELNKINPNITYQHVQRSINIVLEKNNNVMEKRFSPKVSNQKRLKKIRKYKYADMIDIIEENRMTHYMPKPEFAVNDAIWEKILDLPRGGAGLLIGTQGPIMAPAKELRNKYNYLCCCNIGVGLLLDKTTKIKLTNVVGDAVDADKSDRKFILWQTIDISKNWNNIKEKVDERAVWKHASFLAERHDLVKVVIMNSGSLNGYTMKKHNLVANFEKVAKKLVKRYPHLHLIAMQMLHGKRFGMRYFHRDIDTLTKT
jgi:hypothetical protein